MRYLRSTPQLAQTFLGSPRQVLGVIKKDDCQDFETKILRVSLTKHTSRSPRLEYRHAGSRVCEHPRGHKSPGNTLGVLRERLWHSEAVRLVISYREIDEIFLKIRSLCKNANEHIIQSQLSRNPTSRPFFKRSNPLKHTGKAL